MCALKEVKRLCESGREAQERGGYMEADFYLFQALQYARGLKSPVLEAKILNTQGVFLIARGRPEESLPTFALALERTREKIGENNRLYEGITRNRDKALEHIAVRASLAERNTSARAA